MDRQEERKKRLMQYKSVQRWVTDIAASGIGSEHTERSYLRALDKYVKFTGRTPDQLIADRKRQLQSEDEDERYAAEETLKSFLLDLEEKKMKRSSAALTQAMIKSFYKSNRAAVDIKTPSFVSEPLQPITMEDLRKVDQTAGARKRFFIRFLKDSGMSREDAVEVTYGDVRREFEAGEGYVQLNVLRRKENVHYVTFVGPNTVEALKNYLTLRRNSGEQISDNAPLFASLRGEKVSAQGLSLILRRLGEKIGVKLSPHRLRKFFETYMATQGIHPMILKRWMGHKVSSDVESSYVMVPIPEQKTIYMKAYGAIDLTPKVISREELRKEFFDMLPDEVLEPLARKHDMSTEQLRRVMREKKKTFPELTDEDIEEAKRIIEKTESDNNCPNGNCQRIVSEDELPQLLAEGWEVKTTLPSGKIVIQR